MIDVCEVIAEMDDEIQAQTQTEMEMETNYSLMTGERRRRYLVYLKRVGNVIVRMRRKQKVEILVVLLIHINVAVPATPTLTTTTTTTTSRGTGILWRNLRFVSHKQPTHKNRRAMDNWGMTFELHPPTVTCKCMFKLGNKTKRK